MDIEACAMRMVTAVKDQKVDQSERRPGEGGREGGREGGGEGLVNHMRMGMKEGGREGGKNIPAVQ